MHRKFRRLALATVVACFAGSGVAQAACPTTPASQAFKQFGDNEYYSLAPGGSFESGTSGWTLNGSSPQAGNEKYFLNSSSDATALRIKANSTVVSPSFCVDTGTPTMRLLAKKVTNTTGQLKVEILYKDQSGSAKVAVAGMVDDSAKSNYAYADWNPSNPLKLTTALPISSLGGTATVQLRLTTDKGGDWLADDIYIDPRLY